MTSGFMKISCCPSMRLEAWHSERNEIRSVVKKKEKKSEETTERISTSLQTETTQCQCVSKIWTNKPSFLGADFSISHVVTLYRFALVKEIQKI